MDKSIVSNEYKIFLKLLKNIRTERACTQENLAYRIGETQSFISKCERGERRIDIVELRHFCLGMGITLGEFAQEFEAALMRG
ncbi:helix-turn-helix transcriptional regulator [Rivularia sp. UHCC 0363]|uniref:helix-turn-helix domain-containing protein n=1 Tax=Rivularia sp. UHCC 0363 TaxID=3110244 RepID=UPI002B1F0C9B|nr:helix-turn-helix transcriptional regulator [Rivularia sp. UHCC 0363]MEA5598073.1 helix-turn-helix transcriptional regulator [Rivularia sp. UHCC 0363]